MKKSFKVLIPEQVEETAKIKLEASEIEVSDLPGIKRKNLLEIIHLYDGIITRNETDIDEEFLDKAKKLKIIVRAGSGYDNINLEYATHKEIIVANTPESNIISAAEHTMALILASCRNIPHANTYTKNGKWERGRFKGCEIFNKTLGIIGFGKIGGLVALRAKAFGMNVIAFDPYLPDYPFINMGVKRAEELAELLQTSDIITIHTPKTDETQNIIGEKEIKLMKNGVRIVNVARGGLYNEKSLAKAIKSGKIASLAIDTWEKEPQTNNELYKFDNVVVTPHLGATTFEAQQRVASEAADRIICALFNKPIKNILNVKILEKALANKY